MATALTNPAQFKAIADAIRAKTGETGTIVCAYLKDYFESWA